MSSISIFIGILMGVVLILTLIFKKIRAVKKKTAHRITSAQTSSFPSLVEDFSGDDRWDTELDLAKAYLELHQHEKVKPLLKSVITHGAPHQILEARKMFTLLLKQERTA